MQHIWLFIVISQAASFLEECPEIIEDRDALLTCGYFIPICPPLFNIWRSAVLQGTILEQLSDPGVFPLGQVESIVRNLLIKPTAISSIAQDIPEAQFMEPVIRSIYSLRILYDLDLLQIPTETQDVRDISFVRSSIIMTFRIRIPRFRLAWQSLKIIAADNEVSITQLVIYIAQIGETENTKWMQRILGWK